MKKEWKYKMVPCCMSNLHEVICDCDSKSALSAGVVCERYFKGVVEEAIKILGEYLPPDGIDSKETLSRLLGIFDNKEIVERLKRT